ncbi:hypothetical protein EO94_17930 [Methanosarcina sp. 2.H.T.1A.3]|nr:hypothetical protein EO94_17930 [Methanosarcina sp. 2.H.T.1A.3]
MGSEMCIRDRYGHVFKDSEEIREYKDRHENLSPLFEKDMEVIYVESDIEARKVKKEMQKLGIKKKIGRIISDGTYRPAGRSYFYDSWGSPSGDRLGL